MSLETIKKQMEEANAQITKLREELNEKGKQAFGLACKELFAIHPNLKSFQWAQYTPYSCDGDPCEFGVSELVIQLHEPVTDVDPGSIDGVFVEDYYGDGGQWLCGRGSNQHAASKALKDCNEVRHMLDSESLEEMFGDHVKIIVTADEVQTEEYEHN